MARGRQLLLLDLNQGLGMRDEGLGSRVFGAWSSAFASGVPHRYRV
jgi:hypothetical protein